jgi:hypothetical protein
VHERSQFKAGYAFSESRVIIYLPGINYLTPEHATFKQERLEAGSGSIQSGRKPSRTTTNDDDFVSIHDSMFALALIITEEGMATDKALDIMFSMAIFITSNRITKGLTK